MILPLMLSVAAIGGGPLTACDETALAAVGRRIAAIDRFRFDDAPAVLRIRPPGAEVRRWRIE